MMEDELPRWETHPDEGPYRMHTLSGRWPFCQLLQQRTSVSPCRAEMHTWDKHMWTVPFRSQCQLSGFWRRLAILMFTDNAHRDGSPKGDEQDSGTPAPESIPRGNPNCPHGFQNARGLDLKRGSTEFQCISVPMGVHCAFMCTCVCVPICCTQHTCMSRTGTCTCNILSTST